MDGMQIVATIIGVVAPVYYILMRIYYKLGRTEQIVKDLPCRNNGCPGVKRRRR